MRRQSITRLRASGVVLAWALAVGVVTPAYAQTSTGTIRGFVKDAQGQPIVGVSVTATQPETNFQRSTITTQTGFFNLSGLTPERYTVKTSMVGYADRELSVRVLIGQTQNLELTLSEQAIALEGIRVDVARTEAETRTPEVATNITTEQIENIPINDRNFLSLALLAPGVRSDGGSIASGGQSTNNINVFVDGVSFKNDMLVGGVVGQDASQGNPFPQAAVQEFRVITQQYKAEYQKATSAVVTAQTKSGTNDWRGEVFLFGQNSDLVEKDFITARACTDSLTRNPNYGGSACADVAKRDKLQGGVSLGGPILRDRLFVFGTYEGNHITFGETVAPQNLDAVAAINPQLAAELGSHADVFDKPFRSNLYFGKLTYVPAVGSPHRLEASTSIRDEYFLTDFSTLFARESATQLVNDVNTFALRHQFAKSSFTNELSASYQYYQWNPKPDSDLPTSQLWQVNGQTVLNTGARPGGQDWVQDRLSFRNDFTYTLPNRLGDHVFKLGGNVDFLNYNSFQTNNIRPRQTWNSTNDYAFPLTIQAGFGSPGVEIGNEQIGFYIQDDWNVSPRLALNLGLRWDYETNEMNNEHVTRPSDLTALQAYVATLPCDQPPTSATVRARQLICDLDRFTTDGTRREPFKGAIQPRFGFSYDLFGNQRTVLFGGAGVYYDRQRLGYFASEITRGRFEQYTFRFSTDGAPQGTNPTIVWNDSYLTREGLESILQNAAIAPGGELHLYANDLKPPHTNQFTAGIRQGFGPYQVTANYTGVRGYDFLVALRANRNPNGSCCQQNNPIWSNLFAVENRGRSWYDALMFKAEKQYRENSRWGLQFAYTLAWAEQNANPHNRFDNLSDVDPNNLARYPAFTDERHHVTTNWTLGLPYDVRFSGILDLGSGVPYNVTIGFGAGTNNCTHGNQDCEGGNDWPEGKERNWWRPEKQSFIFDAWTYRNVDLRLEKRFRTFREQEIGLIAEVFNVFDYANFNSYNLSYGSYVVQNGQTTIVRTMVCPVVTSAGQPCPVDQVHALGRTTGVITDLRRLGAPRRMQLGLRYQF